MENILLASSVSAHFVWLPSYPKNVFCPRWHNILTFHIEYRITSNKRPPFDKNYLINAPLPEGVFIQKYEYPFVITDENITEAAPQFTLIEEDVIDINVEDDILVSTE